MKLGIRTAATLAALIMLVVAGLLYLASDRMYSAGMSASESRVAMLQTYRIAQSLKSLIHGYELSINEYYSTVLEFPVYQKKVAEQKESIDRELAELGKLQTGDATAVGDLKSALQEMESLRLELEAALNRSDRDWDLAREALFKLNVVSVRAAQPADRIARISGEHAIGLDKAWLEEQDEALVMLRGALPLVLIAAIGLLVGAFRQKVARLEEVAA